MSDKIELLPCPFCGGTDLSVEAWSVQPDNYHAARVVCADCELDGPSSLTLPEPDGCWMPDKESASVEGIKAWNRRAALAQQPAPVAAPSDFALRSRVADLLHLLQFAKFETSSPGDAAQAEVAMNDLERMLAAAPAAPVAVQEPSEEAAYQIGAKGAEPTESERRLFEAWMRGHCWAVAGEWNGKTYVAADEDGRCVNQHAMLTRQLWAAWRDRAALACSAAPAATPQVAQEAVAWAVDVQGYTRLLYNSLSAAEDSARHYSEERERVVSIAPLYTAPPAAEHPYSTTSDKYRAELYDEVWAQARLIGYGNVTEALADLERKKAAERERIERKQPGERAMCHACFADNVRHDHFDSAGKCKVIQLAAEQPECGCCGQTGPCDSDCDCAEQPDIVKVPRDVLRELTDTAITEWHDPGVNEAVQDRNECLCCGVEDGHNADCAVAIALRLLAGGAV